MQKSKQKRAKRSSTAAVCFPFVFFSFLKHDGAVFAGTVPPFHHRMEQPGTAFRRSSKADAKKTIENVLPNGLTVTGRLAPSCPPPVSETRRLQAIPVT